MKTFRKFVLLIFSVFAVTLINSEDLPEYTQFGEISKHDSTWRLYMDNCEVKRKFPDIINFDYYMSMFPHCLIIIDNFREINFVNNFVTNPAIVRTHVQLRNLKTNNVILGPKQIISRNVTTKDKIVASCILSYLLAGENSGTLCAYLDFDGFWRHTKLQNCLVQIRIFEPTFHYKIPYYVTLLPKFHIIRSKVNQIFHNPLAPSCQIFISEPPTATIETCASEGIDSTIQLLSHVFRYYSDIKSCQMLFLHFTVLRVKSHNNRLISPKGFIGPVQLLRLCKYWTQPDLKWIAPHINPESLGNFLFLHKLTLPLANSLLVWNIPEPEYPGENIISRMMFSIIGSCGNFISFVQSPMTLNPVYLIGDAYARLWVSIMGNATIKIDVTDHRCTKRGLQVAVNVRPHVDGWFYFPYTFRDERSTLRFVGCGNRGFNSIPFHELTSIYDKWIWFLIFASTVAVLIPIKYLSKKNEISWISPLKLFLEQGDSFTENVLTTQRLRCVVGATLLMGVVLSNAYKNSNVYNMILPRNPIPYRAFRELIQDNFTVYTSSSYLHISRGYWETKELFNELRMLNGSYAYLAGNGLDLIAVSQVASAMRIIVDSFFNFYLMFETFFENIDNTVLKSTGILSRTALHPNVDGLLNKLMYKLETMRTLERNFYEIVPEITAIEQNLFLQAEEFILLKQLQECNHVAIILPDYLCHKYARKLKADGNRRYVFVGEESYMKIQWMIFIHSSMIPYHFPRRLKGAHEAGVWNRWIQLFNFKQGSSSDGGEVDAAKIDGNVSLIFMLWMLGQGGAFVSFLFEISICTWSYLRRIVLYGTTFIVIH